MKTPRTIAGLIGLSIALASTAIAQQKISDRTSLSAAALAPATDILGIVDISAGASGSKKITIDALFEGWGFTTAGANLAKAANASAQRTALGLGTAATLDHGTSAGNVVRLDASTGKLPAVDGSNLTNLPGGTLASQAEAEAGAENTKTMTPLRTAQAIAALSSGGGLTLATQAEAEAGSDNVKYMTPLRTAQAIAAQAATLGGNNVMTGLNEFNGGFVVDGSVFFNFPSAATGDIFYRASGGNLVRLGIGTSGQVLKVDSGLPAWGTMAGGGDLLAANNLSDLANAATARTNLGLAIGSNVQAWDTDLDSWAAKTAPSGAAVGTTDTQTLTNKTLTGPVVNVGSDATGDIYYRNSGGAFTRLAAGTNGHVLTLASGIPSWAAAAGGGGLTNFTESSNNSTPNATKTVVQLLATNAATNVDAVFSAKGTGAILAQIPDNTTTGGNKRGDYAVDFQRERTSATQVASGLSSGTLSGRRNSATQDYSVVAGGGSNQATGLYAMVPGGNANQAQSLYSFASGYSATSSGTGSTAMGQSTVASGDSSFAVGEAGSASASWSASIGYANLANGIYSFAFGRSGDARNSSSVLVHSAGAFASNGDAQYRKFILRRLTSGTTAGELYVDGSTASANFRMTLPSNSVFSYSGRVSARSSTGVCAGWFVQGTIKRSGGGTAMVGTPTMTPQVDAGASGWVLTVDADTTNNSLRIQGAASSGDVVRWVATIETAEVVY